MNTKKHIFEMMSLQTFKRMPNYYNYLCSLSENNVEYASAPTIAKALGLSEIQVRKDLAAVSRTPGKPKKGFLLHVLLSSIAECLGYNNREDAVLVGAGKLGTALLNYSGFEQYGVRIVAAFDSDEKIIQQQTGKKIIFPTSQLPSLCKRLHVHIGIIAVPAEQAQSVCDVLVHNGILAIWNFAPVHLQAPKEILIQNEDLGAQLASLSQHLAHKLL